MCVCVCMLVCVWNEHVNVYVWDCSIGVSATPPVTLRFPPMRRNVTSPLCFPTQEYKSSKNVFLFKGSQQPSFLLSLAALCVSVCTLVIIYIVGPINRKCWDADEDAAGCIFPHWAVPIYRQGSCFITHSGCGANGGDWYVSTHFNWSDTHTHCTV